MSPYAFLLVGGFTFWLELAGIFSHVMVVSRDCRSKDSLRLFGKTDVVTGFPVAVTGFSVSRIASLVCLFVLVQSALRAWLRVADVAGCA